MRNSAIICFLLWLPGLARAQADNEIQVYASPTVENKWTIFELHSNYTFRGSKFLTNTKSARWTNETLEITHGFGKNFEIGLYTFTGFAPGGNYIYQGNQIRPRVTVPSTWKWPFGTSLSVEFGFFKLDDTTKSVWQGEIRPIMDKTFGNWYFAFNPNISFVVTGNDKGADITPQLKTVYNIRDQVGIGIEYYGLLGSFKKILPTEMQEHLIGPMIDLYIDPMWEINGGMLFGLTKNSNQQILKILIGRRIGKK
jgi:hypothetical protein